MTDQNENKKTNFLDLLVKTLFIVAIITGVKFFYKFKQQKNLQDQNRENLYAHMGGDFSLQSKEGDYHLKDLKGKPSILYFGFTSCPDICPISLSRLNQAIDKIDPSIHNKINKVFISVDWKRDTPQKVQEYASHFGNYIGLSGNQKQIEDMTKKYAVHFQFVEMKDSAMKYTVDHTSRFYVLNSDGKLMNTFSDINNDPKFKNEILKLTQ